MNCMSCKVLSRNLLFLGPKFNYRLARKQSFLIELQAWSKIEL